WHMGHPFQHPRRPENLAKRVAPSERKMNRAGPIEQKLKEQSLFVATVADLADSELSAVAIQQKWIVDAPLRKCRLLRSDDEQMIEAAAAELHYIAGPNQLSVLGSRL